MTTNKYQNVMYWNGIKINVILKKKQNYKEQYFLKLYKYGGRQCPETNLTYIFQKFPLE